MTENSDKSTEDKRERFWGSLGHLPLIWWFVTLGMIFLWFLTPTIVQDLHNKTEEKGSGAFGDTFGYITSLFSIVTTMLVVAGLIFQRREIDQLEQALKQQAEEAEIQNGLTRQQMAYTEIQARIDALPALRASVEVKSPPLDGISRGGDDRPQLHLVLSNQGADIYALRLAIAPNGFHTASLARGGVVSFKIGPLDEFRGRGLPMVILDYVTRYGERRNTHFTAVKDPQVVGDFFEDAQQIRGEVLQRYSLRDPHAAEAT